MGRDQETNIVISKLRHRDRGWGGGGGGGGRGRMWNLVGEVVRRPLREPRTSGSIAAFTGNLLPGGMVPVT